MYVLTALQVPYLETNEEQKHSLCVCEYNAKCKRYVYESIVGSGESEERFYLFFPDHATAK